MFLQQKIHTQAMNIINKYYLTPMYSVWIVLLRKDLNPCPPSPLALSLFSKMKMELYYTIMQYMN